MRPSRQGLLHLALAWVLLFAQQWVLHHTLEHESDPTHHSAHGTCLSCLSAHAVDHASAGTPGVAFAIQAVESSQAAAPLIPHAPIAQAPFQARAPPAFPA